MSWRETGSVKPSCSEEGRERSNKSVNRESLTADNDKNVPSENAQVLAAHPEADGTTEDYASTEESIDFIWDDDYNQQQLIGNHDDDNGDVMLRSDYDEINNINDTLTNHDYSFNFNSSEFNYSADDDADDDDDDGGGGDDCDNKRCVDDAQNPKEGQKNEKQNEAGQEIEPSVTEQQQQPLLESTNQRPESSAGTKAPSVTYETNEVCGASTHASPTGSEYTARQQSNNAGNQNTVVGEPEVNVDQTETNNISIDPISGVTISNLFSSPQPVNQHFSSQWPGGVKAANFNSGLFPVPTTSNAPQLSTTFNSTWFPVPTTNNAPQLSTFNSAWFPVPTTSNAPQLSTTFNPTLFPVPITNNAPQLSTFNSAWFPMPTSNAPQLSTTFNPTLFPVPITSNAPQLSTTSNPTLFPVPTTSNRGEASNFNRFSFGHSKWPWAITTSQVISNGVTQQPSDTNNGATTRPLTIGSTTQVVGSTQYVSSTKTPIMSTAQAQTFPKQTINPSIPINTVVGPHAPNNTNSTVLSSSTLPIPLITTSSGTRTQSSELRTLTNTRTLNQAPNVGVLPTSAPSITSGQQYPARNDSHVVRQNNAYAGFNYPSSSTGAQVLGGSEPIGTHQMAKDWMTWLTNTHTVSPVVYGNDHRRPVPSMAKPIVPSLSWMADRAQELQRGDCSYFLPL